MDAGVSLLALLQSVHPRMGYVVCDSDRDWRQDDGALNWSVLGLSSKAITQSLRFFLSTVDTSGLSLALQTGLAKRCFGWFYMVILG